MKHYNTAREILQASLEDIEDGRWICSKLACSTIGDKYFEGHYIPKDEPMGCALGLIATHGGHGKSETLTVAGVEWESFIPAYPSDPAWREGGEEVWDSELEEYVVEGEILGPPASQAVLDARDTLIRASGETPGTDYDDDPPDHQVYSHNDALKGSGDRAPEIAAQWFRDALALLDEPVAA